MPRLLRKYWHEVMLDTVRLHTNAPDSFISWAAFSVIGGIMKRKFFIQEGLFTIYPNQYIVLVGPPAVGKGTAINFNWKIVRDSGPPLGPGYVANMIPDRVTGPRILERLAAGWNTAPQLVGGQIKQGATDHTCTIFSSELSMLLGASDQMIDYLCELWDRNEYEYDTKNSGSAFIKDTCVSLIAGTVPDFIRNIDRNRNLTISGGFTSRCVFVFEESPARYILHPPPIATNKTSMALLAQLQNDAYHIASLPGGEFQYDAQAKIIYDKYLTSLLANVREDSDAVSHFKGRIGVHILKLAMVLAISREDTLLINSIDMAKAIGMVGKSLTNLEKVFRGSGDSDLDVATAYVQNYLEKYGGATRRELLRNLYRHMNAETLDRILYVLVEIGYCTNGGATGLFVVVNKKGAALNGHKPQASPQSQPAGTAPTAQTAPVGAGVKKP